MTEVFEQARSRAGLAQVFYSAALFVLGGYVLWIGKSVIIPVVIAVFLAFLIVTVKRQFEHIPKVGPLLPEPVTFALAFGNHGTDIVPHDGDQ
ncbi:MAG: hypothetical protein AAFU56_11555, partial [Pseudomonadota bacterium]